MLPDPNLHRLLELNKIRENRVHYAKVEGAPYVVTKLDGTIKVFSAICPHALGDLSYGTIVEAQIDCPSHGWRFDLNTGLCQWPDDTGQRLKFLETEEHNGWLYLRKAPNDYSL